MARTSRKKDDAIALLKSDHREVAELFKEFEQLENADTDAVEPVIASACAALKIHDKLESEIFYPAIREQAGDEKEIEDLLNEAEVEHDHVRELVQKIEGMGSDDVRRDAHFTVLVEYVKHHVKEEEKEMFPKLKKLDIDFAELGRQMKARKSALMSEMGVEAEEASEETA